MGTGDQHYCLPLLVPGMLYFFSLLKVIILMPDPYTHTHRYAALWLTTCDTKTSEDERCCPPLWLDFIFARIRLKTAVARSAAPGFPGLTAPFPQSCNHFKPHSHHYAVCVCVNKIVWCTELKRNVFVYLHPFNENHDWIVNTGGNKASRQHNCVGIVSQIITGNIPDFFFRDVAGWGEDIAQNIICVFLSWT